MIVKKMNGQLPPYGFPQYVPICDLTGLFPSPSAGQVQIRSGQGNKNRQFV